MTNKENDNDKTTFYEDAIEFCGQGDEMDTESQEILKQELNKKEKDE